MIADSTYVMGKGHKVCQDYALSKVTENEGCIIVSDGCSGSPHTDMGSRLLSWSANQLDVRDMSFGIKTIANASQIIKILNLPEAALDATLLTASYKKGEPAVVVKTFGDGAILAKGPDVNTMFISLKYDTGYPYFLNYLYQNAMGAFLRMNPGITPEIQVFEIGKDFESHIDFPNTTDLQAQIKFFDEKNIKIQANDHQLTFEFDKTKYNEIVLFTDGIFSFFKIIETSTSKFKSPLSPIIVVPDLVDFKTCSNGFLYRRMMRFKQVSETEQLFHDDDLGMAALKI